MVVSGGAFAQRHMVYGGLGLNIGVPCVGGAEVFASYEFAIIPRLSIGISAAYQVYPLAVYAVLIDRLAGGEDVIKDIYGPVAEAQVHFYPGEDKFHIDLGIGYSNYLRSMHTLLIAPGFGWRFDFGEPGGFFINLGLRTEIFIPVGDGIIKTDEGKNLKAVNFVSARLGFGFRF